MGYRLYEQYGDQLKSLVLPACAPVIKAVTSGAEPTLEELMVQKERLEDLIAEKNSRMCKCCPRALAAIVSAPRPAGIAEKYIKCFPQFSVKNSCLYKMFSKQTYYAFMGGSA